MSYRELEAAGLRLAVSEVGVRYRQPARFDDPLRVRCWVRDLASRRVEFGYAVEHAEDGRLLATATAALLALDAGMALRPLARRGAPGAPTDSRSRSAPSSPAARGRLPVSVPSLRFLRPSGAGMSLLLAAGPLAAQQRGRGAARAAARRGGRPQFPARALRARSSSPDSLVRRVAALAAGRIGDPARRPLLVPLLSDPDSTVRVAAAFAPGLLADSAAVQPLIDRLTGTPALDAADAPARR